MKVHVITNCSSTRLIQPLAKVEDLPDGLTNQEGIDAWLEILNKYPANTSPREQYRGQGFLTLLKTLSEFKSIQSVHIVTGGLGFTDIDDSIVPYDFSGSAKEPHNITQKVTKEPFSLGVWWSLINKARHKTMTPVKDFIEGLKDDEVCVIACSKGFLKYIAQDFLSASPEAKDRTKILLTASSIGSVPMQLRPYIISFERASIQHIPGNRNDIQHRALYQFMNTVTTMEEFNQPGWSLSEKIYGSQTTNTSTGYNILDMIQTRPHLLQFDPDTAYKALYREVGPFGGKQNFKGIFLQYKISQGLIKAGEDVEADDDAISSLSGLGLTDAAPTNQSDDKTSELIRIFTAAVRKANEHAEFSAADICNWAKSYTGKKEIELPEMLSSPIKLSYHLKSYAPLFGMERLDKMFKLQTQDLEEEEEA